ncbi:MAG: U32 family peptidase [Candidatus Tectomicrobia bacterium]|uniref:U32 family peptidase n=1 Tax=Tectimicrobiota bacterium TaxID=2528274 RepID=A0A932MMZ8_UNCTE|nr:U32 family peptidase [Candidatus Tectomicrobia bacterium]
MRLSVASNYDPRLVEGLAGYPVEEVYGKLPADCLGGGRASYMLGPLSRRRLAEHAAHVRRAGMRFNYLLNAACWDNRETTRRGQRELRGLLDWIVSIGAGAVTVSIPSILALIKRSYPALHTRVSVFACVDSVQKARYWEDAGADCICLDSLQVNREFRALEAIRRHVSCDLQLLVNNSCLQHCSLAHAHMTHLAHASQKGHASGGFLVDWCFLKCTAMKLDDPVNYIRADWIRPEDLGEYERLGYENFKIVERNAPTDLLLARVKAYSERRYEGNLLDLVQPYGHGERWRKGEDTGRARRWRLRHLVRPWKLGLSPALRLKALAEARGFLPGTNGGALSSGETNGGPLHEKNGGPMHSGESNGGAAGAGGRNGDPVYVDNRALDGFIERFRRLGCRDVSCEACGHCREYAGRAVVIDPAFRERCRALYASLFRDMDTGAFFGCAPRRGEHVS